MPTFKELSQRDIDNVFFNTTEFADEYTIDGKKMPAMIDDCEQLERSNSSAESHTDGVFLRTTLLYVKAADFGELPAIGRILILNGKKYTVIDTADEYGVYTITLEANRSR
jgi:hypothetical protein